MHKGDRHHRDFSVWYDINYLERSGIIIDWETLTPSMFIKLSKTIIPSSKHCDYSAAEYVNRKTKVPLTCKKCNSEFQVSPIMHLQYGQACPCLRKGSKKDKRLQYFSNKLGGENNPNFIYRAADIFTDSLYIDVTCVLHNTVFSEKKSNVVDGVFRCPVCNPSKSSGELKVESYLNGAGITFEDQWTGHPDKSCINPKTNRRLRFDFYLPDHNIAIEYDGEQHSIPIEYWGGEDKLYNQQQLDEIKNIYCAMNNIHLIRIPYTDFKNVSDILSDLLRI